MQFNSIQFNSIQFNSIQFNETRWQLTADVEAAPDRFGQRRTTAAPGNGSFPQGESRPLRKHLNYANLFIYMKFITLICADCRTCAPIKKRSWHRPCRTSSPSWGNAPTSTDWSISSPWTRYFFTIFHHFSPFFTILRFLRDFEGVWRSWTKILNEFQGFWLKFWEILRFFLGITTEFWEILKEFKGLWEILKDFEGFWLRFWGILRDFKVIWGIVTEI